MTQLLDLDLVTADPDNSLPTDGPAGPGRVLISSVTAAGTTLQTAVDNGSEADIGSAGTTVALSGDSRSDEVLTVTQASATAGTPISTFSGDHSSAHVKVSGPAAEGDLKLYGNQITSSDERLDLGADSVGSVGIQSGTLRVPVGTSALPSIANDTDPGTGVDVSATTVGLSVAGTAVALAEGGDLVPGVAGTSKIGTAAKQWDAVHAERFEGGGGSAADPVFAPDDAEETGMYLNSAGTLGFGTVGAERALLDSTAFSPASDQLIQAGTEDLRFSESWAAEEKCSASSIAGVERTTTAVTAETVDLADTKALAVATSIDSAVWIEVTAVLLDPNTLDSGMLKSVVRATNAASVLSISTPVALASDLATGLVGATISFDVSGTSVDINVNGGKAGQSVNWSLTVSYQTVKKSW